MITKLIEGVTRNSPCTRDPNAGLHVAAEHACALWDALLTADPSLRPAGNNAISAMRIEKGYRALGYDAVVSLSTPHKATAQFSSAYDPKREKVMR